MQKSAAHTAQQIFKDLAEGITKPFYAVVGEEPFQADEILEALQKVLVKDESTDTFNFETWDGEGLDADGILASLDMLPGLFGEVDAKRFIVCQRFDKASSHAIEKLTRYFQNPSDATVFLVFAAKVDKRKAWVKAVQEKGYLVEIREPYEREWPKWQGYFEKKLKKKLSAEAWIAAVEASARSLSLLWSELQKLALYVADRDAISLNDVRDCLSTGSEADIFGFAEKVARREKYPAFEQYQVLRHAGENEIKILSILVRQFRMIDRFQKLSQKGVSDPRQMAGEVGVHPFFLSKIESQAKGHTSKGLQKVLGQLAECDYRLKRGEGELFTQFLIPYFAS